MQIEEVPTASVIAYAKNAREHSDEQVAAIAESIKAFGFVNPCLVDADGILIAGHGRVLAAQRLGLEAIPIIRLGHLTPDQVKAYRIADNRLPEGSTWNLETIKLELTELQLTGFDLTLTGFDLGSLEAKAPDDFAEVGDDLATEHECPRCHYKWSGQTGLSRPVNGGDTGNTAE